MKKMIGELWISLEHHHHQPGVSGDELSEIFEFELNSLRPHHPHQPPDGKDVIHTRNMAGASGAGGCEG